ncbi:MAG: hypothetical protein L3J79_04865, partial [Candidatus Marinimicrobia bacterium]|nr:hypothetical protein [Candidatus Neomarinimicrobiota bacterium]
MKIRITISLIAISLAIWSCDEPKPFDNPTFSYNPFSFQQDTLHNIEETTPGKQSIEWGDHLRAWVGDTQYYRAGFSLDFSFSDSNLIGVDADSVQLWIRHQTSYPENGADTLVDTYKSFNFYQTTGVPIDLSAGIFGEHLGNDTMDVKSENNFWTFTLPDSTIMAGDTSIGLGVFPDEAGIMSVLYGGGSTIRPSLMFFFHEP